MAKKVIYVPSCHSTNSLAEQYLADSDMPEGTVIITNNQTSGKGRMDKSWESQKGQNLTLSIVLKPTFLPLERQFQLNIFSSLALASTVTKFGAVQPEIKWPNDILVDGNKISGILVKNILKGKSISNSILGIGLNVNQTDFIIESATSIKRITGFQLELQEVFESLIKSLEKYYFLLRESAFEPLQKEYMGLLYGLNKELQFESGSTFRGIITGVNQAGQLLIQTEQGQKVFNLNEIKYISQPE